MKKNTTKSILILIIILTILLSITYWLNDRFNKIMSNPVTLKGVIIKVKTMRFKSYLDYKFIINANDYYSFQQYHNENRFKVREGDSCLISYEKDNPDNSVLLEVYISDKE